MIADIRSNLQPSIMSETLYQKPLDHPPVVEVIFGFQAVTSDELTKESAQERLDAAMPDGFSIVQVVDNVNLEFRNDGDGPIKHKHSQSWSGIKLTAQEGKVVAHFMRFGLFINFMDYRNFEEAIPLVRSLWGVYTTSFEPAVTS